MAVPNAGTAAVSSAQQILASLVRTFVPFLIGVLIKGFAQIGVVLDTETATLLVNGVISAGIALLYYFVVRLLEVFKSSKFGWLLGYASAAPLYLKPAGTVQNVVVDEQPAVVQPPADNPPAV